MARRPAIWLVTILVAIIIVVGATAAAGTRGYVVSPAGLLLTLDADTDMVIGLSQIPILPPGEGSGRRFERSSVAQASRLWEVSQLTGDGTTATGRALITPQGDRLLVLDPLPYGLPRGFLIDEGPTGRIFVYDVATGAKLGHVAFSVGGGDRLAAVHPRGDKAYVASQGPRGDRMTITVVSLTTFTVLKQLFVPGGDLVLSQTVR